MLHLRIALVITLLCTTNGLAREWSDSSGKFKIVADLVDASANSVRLKKPEGQIVTVPLARLGQPDQDFVAKALALNSAASVVLKRHCYSCHGENGTDEGGMNFVLNAARLKEKGKITAGQPDKSKLVSRITSMEMPPADSGSRPSAAEIQTLRDWITSGAVGSTPESRGFIAQDAILTAIAEDLSGTDERTRVFYRYFTITHLYNAGLDDEELNTVRLALAKLLNSLSWDRKIITPQSVDREKTVLRIDVRDLRWTRELWEILVLAYPYGLQQSSTLAANVYKQSGTRLPYVRTDWFVAQASRPPLYYALLQLPDTIDGLQQQLKINFSQNVRQDRAIRAGFTKSGVSTNPRVIERHEISDGACWISYDFAASAGSRNFFNNPLNFEFDGNEVIFSLPNGLQAFMIFNREGARLDKAPSNIVRDPRAPDAAVMNGLSCLRCHANGIIPKQDEVRKHAAANPRAFNAEKLKTIEALYPASDTFERHQSDDQKRFREALTKIGIARISIDGEPVFNTARRFSEPLDLAFASAEMGCSPADFLAAMDKSPVLQQQVGPLRVAGGTIPRDVFTEAFGALAGPLRAGRYLAPGGRFVEPTDSEVVATTGDTAAPATDEGANPAGAVAGVAAGAGGDIRAGLVHHWRFDETKGDIARDSQGKVNASLSGWNVNSRAGLRARSGMDFSFPPRRISPFSARDQTTLKSR